MNYFFIYDGLVIILIKTIMGLIPQHEAPKETFDKDNQVAEAIKKRQRELVHIEANKE
ncbi:hypothetical protein HpMS70_00100 [Helicobacter pylori]